MGADIESEHYLTPRGWEAGEVPPDRVETWTRRIYQEESPHSQIIYTCEWASPDIPRAERDALRAEHAEFMRAQGRFADWVVVTIGEPL
jgi:hypothetical protein